MKNGNFRLDMAEESADFLKIDVKTAQKRVGENVTVRVTCVQKDEESRALNRDKGKYITVDAEKNVAYPSVKRDVTAAVKDAARDALSSSSPFCPALWTILITAVLSPEKLIS